MRLDVIKAKLGISSRIKRIETREIIYPYVPYLLYAPYTLYAPETLLLLLPLDLDLRLRADLDGDFFDFQVCGFNAVQLLG